MKKMNRALLIFIAIALAAIFMLPIVLTFIYSFESPKAISAMLNDTQSYESTHFVSIRIAPMRATLYQYFSILLDQVEYIRFYANSILYAVSITAGQLIIGAMAAFALSFYRVRAASAIFNIYTILMLLPFQIIMVPNYIMLRTLNLLDTYSALILPGIFSPLSVVLIRQYMVTLPSVLLEAGIIDGAKNRQLFMQIIVPVCKPVLCTALALVFADSWNMVEQPLVLLKNQQLYPLSLSLLNGEYNNSTEFAASALYMLPPLLLFLYFHEDVTLGIQLGNLK